jgi:hypothetical protein
VRDRGLDAAVHRLTDGAYIAVQIKGRTELTAAGQVHIAVTESSLVDDSALIIATLIDGAELGELVLVVDEGTFKSLAARDVVNGKVFLTAAFEMHAGGRSRWADHLVPRENLAARLGGTTMARTSPPLDEVSILDRGQEGFLGEAEVIRLLAEEDALEIFRPFPDLETVEVLVRHAESGRFLGIQVKTAGFDAATVEQRVYVRRSSFRPAASTFVCVLGWDRAAHRFAEDLLFIPSADIESIAREEGDFFVLEVAPASSRHRRLDGYRVSLRSMPSSVEKLLSEGL